MAIAAERLIETARSYLGTRYQNQGRSREDGLDCGGLLLVVGRDLGLTQLEHLGYSNSPDGETFERLLDENLWRVDDNEWRQPKPGWILAMDYGDGIQHTAIVTEPNPRLKVLHAKRPIGKAKYATARGMRGVIEQYLHGRDQKCWARSYRIPGVVCE